MIQKYIEANNNRFFLVSWGDRVNPPLLLLHGLASRVHMFSLIAPKLAEHFYVFAFDQRGHGLSDKPNDGYDFETISQDIDAILKSLKINPPIQIVGPFLGSLYCSLLYCNTFPLVFIKLYY